MDFVVAFGVAEMLRMMNMNFNYSNDISRDIIFVPVAQYRKLK